MNPRTWDDRSISERLIALAKDGGLSISTAGKPYFVLKSTARAWLKKYRRDGQDGRRRGTGSCGVSSPAQDAVLVAEVQRNPFVTARDLQASTGFPGQKSKVISRLKEAGHRAQPTALKELLTDDHKLYCSVFAESNVDRKWDRVIFCDECTFSPVNYGPLVYRTLGQRYNCQYMSGFGDLELACWPLVSV